MTLEVAVVRPGQRTDPMIVGGGFQGRTSKLNLNNVSLDWLLSLGYGVSSHQISGMPDWAKSAIFNVQAKGDNETEDKLATLTPGEVKLEQQHMVQALLVDRFNFKLHWETKDGPILALTVAKNGPKFRPAGSLPPSPAELERFGNHPIPPLYQRGNGQPGYEFVGHGCRMEALASMLGALLGTDVKDQTGLMETYDFLLQYHGSRPGRENDDPAVWPALTDAVPDQLGLKLEAAKGPVRWLVIDHVEKPSEN